MPSPKKIGTTRILAQVPTQVHEAADARRRREHATWDRVIAELLRRWGEGDDTSVTAPVRRPKVVQVPRDPSSERAQYLAWSERWARENPEAAAKVAEKIDPSKLPRYGSLGELLAADASRKGRLA